MYIVYIAVFLLVSVNESIPTCLITIRISQKIKKIIINMCYRVTAKKKWYKKFIIY